MRVSRQIHAPATLYPQERTPGTHWLGGWMGLRNGLDTVTRENFYASVEDRTPVVQSVAVIE
jgi:hypothetical protein